MLFDEPRTLYEVERAANQRAQPVVTSTQIDGVAQQLLIEPGLHLDLRHANAHHHRRRASAIDDELDERRGRDR